MTNVQQQFIDTEEQYCIEQYNVFLFHHMSRCRCCVRHNTNRPSLHTLGIPQPTIYTKLTCGDACPCECRSVMRHIVRFPRNDRRRECFAVIGIE